MKIRVKISIIYKNDFIKKEKFDIIFFSILKRIFESENYSVTVNSKLKFRRSFLSSEVYGLNHKNITKLYNKGEVEIIYNNSKIIIFSKIEISMLLFTSVVIGIMIFFISLLSSLSFFYSILNAITFSTIFFIISYFSIRAKHIAIINTCLKIMRIKRSQSK